jgi:hypothetical protein
MFGLFGKAKTDKEVILESHDFMKMQPKVGYDLYLGVVEGVKSYESSSRTCNTFVNELLKEAYGTSGDTLKLKKNLNSELIVICGQEFTKASLIKRWMELQDLFLIPTFMNTMKYSEFQIEMIKNSLSLNEVKFAESLLNNFYENYLLGRITGLSLNSITEKNFALSYTNNLKFGIYSNIMLRDNNSWKGNQFINFLEDDEDEEDDDDIEEIENIEIKLDLGLGDSINEVSNRNWDFYYPDSVYMESSNLKKPINIPIYKHDLLEVSVFSALDKYVYELESFKNLYPPRLEFLSIYDHGYILSHFSRKDFKKISKLIDATYGFSSGNYVFRDNRMLEVFLGLR